MKKVEGLPVASRARSRAIRAIAISVLVGVVALIVSYGAMTAGYILVVAALSIFFLMVAFDIGVTRHSSDTPAD